MESSNQDPIIREIPAQIILGAVAFGKPKPTTRDHPLASDEACHDLIEHFYTRGGRELDTARVYQKRELRSDARTTRSQQKNQNRYQI